MKKTLISLIAASLIVKTGVVVFATGNQAGTANAVLPTKTSTQINNSIKVDVTKTISGKLTQESKTGSFVVEGYVLRVNDPSILLKYVNSNITVTGTVTKTSDGRQALQVTDVKPIVPVTPVTPKQPVTPPQPSTPVQPITETKTILGKLTQESKTGSFVVEGYVLRVNDPSILLKYVNSNITVTGTVTKTSDGKQALQVTDVKPIVPVTPVTPKQPVTPPQSSTPPQPSTPVQPITETKTISGKLTQESKTGSFVAEGYVLRVNDPRILLKYVNSNITVTGTVTKTSDGRPALQVTSVHQ